MTRIPSPAALALILGLCAAAPALAQSAPAEGPGPICADRPTKGTSACTVEAGHLQVEVGIADVTQDRSGGATTETGAFGVANIRYGLSDRINLEMEITPLATQAVSGGGRTSGFGDTLFEAKLALLQGDTAISMLPYIKAPTAGAGLGNGALEGGVIVPIAFTLPGQMSLTLDPEIDLLKNAVNQGRHLSYIMVAGLSRPLSATFTGSVELWGQQDQEPTGAVTQASFDLGLSWIPIKDHNLQLDGGLNLGLNRATPGLEGYVGISRRF